MAKLDIEADKILINKLKDGDFDTWNNLISYLSKFNKNPEYEELITPAISYAIEKYNGKSPFISYCYLKLSSLIRDRIKANKRGWKHIDEYFIPTDCGRRIGVQLHDCEEDD